MVDTEHLLVALLEEQDESIETIWTVLDITPEEVLQRARTLLVEWASPGVLRHDITAE